MPTPVPSSAPAPVPPALIGSTALAPVPACSRLAWREVARFGEMLNTSLRAARASSAAAGTMPETARTEM